MIKNDDGNDMSGLCLKMIPTHIAHASNFLTTLPKTC